MAAKKTWFNEHYHSEDVFYCDSFPCNMQGIRFTHTADTWCEAETGGESYPACPHCGNIVEEDTSDVGGPTWGGRDY